MKRSSIVLVCLLFALALSCAATERGASMNERTTSTPGISADQAGPKRNNETAAPDGSRRDPGRQTPRSWKIDYEVSGGFAGIQRTMNLSGDGKLIATDLKQKRTVERQVPEDQLTGITDILAALDYERVPDSHSKLTDRCADCFQHMVTVMIDSRRHTISGNDVSLRNSPYTSFIGILSSLLADALANKNIER